MDALIFPLDTSKLAALNPDRQAFFALENQLEERYLSKTALPATLAEYTARVVTLDTGTTEEGWGGWR